MAHKTLPTAPDHLSAAAAGWWGRIVKNWDLDAAGLLILTAALESFDRAEQARAVVEAEGLLVDGKPHSAVRIEWDSRAGMLSALKQLHLDLEPIGPVGRPPGGRR
jgi:phage terminase small subunit